MSMKPFKFVVSFGTYSQNIRLFEEGEELPLDEIRQSWGWCEVSAAHNLIEKETRTIGSLTGLKSDLYWSDRSRGLYGHFEALRNGG